MLLNGSYWACGPEGKEFESMLATYHGTDHALTFNSGTSALHSMLLAYDVRCKEVIVPSYTFISTVNAILLAGGIPVFADVEPDTHALDLEKVKDKVTENTKAIILVHYAGCPARDTIAITNYCQQSGLILIEDNAESMGATINGKLVGTFGDSAMLSFCQNKIVATGEGGAVVTNNTVLFEKLKLVRSHGRLEPVNGDYFSSTDKQEYMELGYNYRLPTILAALGTTQLKKNRLSY